MVVAENHTYCNQTEEQIHALTLKYMATTKKTTSPKTAEKKAPAKKATAKKETAAPATKAPVREALTAEEKARVKKLKETLALLKADPESPSSCRSRSRPCSTCAMKCCPTCRT